MAGRFEGVSDLEGRLFEHVFPPAPQKRGRGMPQAPFRQVVNTLLYVLITGCRWWMFLVGHNGPRSVPRIAG